MSEALATQDEEYGKGTTSLQEVLLIFAYIS